MCIPVTPSLITEPLIVGEPLTNNSIKKKNMYSLIRLFDKKKMEYFDSNFKDNHLYLTQRGSDKDCLDDGKQLELIKKIIDTVSIEPE